MRNNNRGKQAIIPNLKGARFCNGCKRTKDTKKFMGTLGYYVSECAMCREEKKLWQA